MDNKMIADYVKALSPERVLFLHNSFGKDPKIHPMGELDKTYKGTPPLEFMSLAEKGNFCMGDSYFFQDGDKLCSFSDPKDGGLLDMLTVSARSIVKSILDKLERYNDFDIIRMHNEITEEGKHIYPTINGGAGSPRFRHGEERRPLDKSWILLYFHTKGGSADVYQDNQTQNSCG